MHRILGKTQRFCKDVRRAAGQWGQSGLGARDPIRRLIQRPVAAEYTNQVEPLHRRPPSKTGGMAASSGLHQSHVVICRQRFLDDDSSSGGHRRGGCIDDQSDSHRPILAAGIL